MPPWRRLIDDDWLLLRVADKQGPGSAQYRYRRYSESCSDRSAVAFAETIKRIEHDKQPERCNPPHGCCRQSIPQRPLRRSGEEPLEAFGLGAPFAAMPGAPLAAHA